MKKLGLLATVIAAIAFSAAPASADLGGALKQNTQDDGNTTILFTTSFSEPDYTEGETIGVVVHWHVVFGEATFKEVGFRNKGRCCSKGVDADIVSFLVVDGPAHAGGEAAAHHFPGHVGTLTLMIRFNELRGECNDLRGKAHFKFKLNIDKKGGAGIDSVVGYGFNVKVRDDCT